MSAPAAEQTKSGAPLLPGAVLGVLGGGQLGRMFVHAAQRLGFETVVLDPDPASPAGRVAHEHVRTAYLDVGGLARMAERCAAVTTEFENVPAAALATLAEHLPVAPGAAAVSICQDRAEEKALFGRSGVACAPHAVLRRGAALAEVDASLLPGILKTTRLGYDGKGQRPVADRAALAAAFAVLDADCVLEKRLPLAAEVSVIVARGADGSSVHLPVQENLHRDGILALTRVPPSSAAIGPTQLAEAAAWAHCIAAALDYVGVLCVEFFVLADGSLVANEMAPRPHNSGHYSVDACDVSQFELQVRAMASLPLVEPRQHSPCVMLNLLGDLWVDAAGRERTPDWAGLLALPGAHLHLYGKAEARPGRKMGHATFTAPTAVAAEAVAARCAALLDIAAWNRS